MGGGLTVVTDARVLWLHVLAQLATQLAREEGTQQQAMQVRRSLLHCVCYLRLPLPLLLLPLHAALSSPLPRKPALAISRAHRHSSPHKHHPPHLHLPTLLAHCYPPPTHTRHQYQ